MWEIKEEVAVLVDGESLVNGKTCFSQQAQGINGEARLCCLFLILQPEVLSSYIISLFFFNLSEEGSEIKFGKRLKIKVQRNRFK